MNLPSYREALIWLLLDPVNIAIKDALSVKVFALANHKGLLFSWVHIFPGVGFNFSRMVFFYTLFLFSYLVLTSV